MPYSQRQRWLYFNAIQPLVLWDCSLVLYLKGREGWKKGKVNSEGGLCFNSQRFKTKLWTYNPRVVVFDSVCIQGKVLMISGRRYIEIISANSSLKQCETGQKKKTTNQQREQRIWFSFSVLATVLCVNISLHCEVIFSITFFIQKMHSKALF